MNAQDFGDARFVEAIGWCSAFARWTWAISLTRQSFAKGQSVLAQVAIDDFINESLGLCFKCSDRRSRENHVQRWARTDEPWQTLGPAGPRNDAQSDFRQTEFRTLVREPIMTRHRELEAATERQSLDGSDDRDGSRFDGRLHLLEGGVFN